MFNNSIFGGTYAIDDNIDLSIMRTRQYFDYLLKYCLNRCKWELPEKSRLPYFLPEYLLSIFGHLAIFYSKDITRLARDFIESSKIYDIILNNNADFYLVDAHESLLKIGKVDNQVISSCIELEKEEDDLEHE